MPVPILLCLVSRFAPLFSCLLQNASKLGHSVWLGHCKTSQNRAILFGWVTAKTSQNRAILFGWVTAKTSQNRAILFDWVIAKRLKTGPFCLVGSLQNVSKPGHSVWLGHCKTSQNRAILFGWVIAKRLKTGPFCLAGSLQKLLKTGPFCLAGSLQKLLKTGPFCLAGSLQNVSKPGHSVWLGHCKTSQNRAILFGWVIAKRGTHGSGVVCSTSR